MTVLDNIKYRIKLLKSVDIEFSKDCIEAYKKDWPDMAQFHKGKLSTYEEFLEYLESIKELS